MGAAGVGSSIPNSSSFLSIVPGIAPTVELIATWRTLAHQGTPCKRQGVSHADNCGDGRLIPAMVNERICGRFLAGRSGSFDKSAGTATLSGDPGCAAIL